VKVSFAMPIRIDGANLDKRMPLGPRMARRRFAQNRRAKMQRHAARLAVLANTSPIGRTKLVRGPYLVVTLTRLSAGELDDDNLRAGCKHIRDGIADAFKLNDRDPMLRWLYVQERCAAKSYSIRVTIESMEKVELVGRVFQHVAEGVG
jgi:hypothetical protein